MIDLNEGENLFCYFDRNNTRLWNSNIVGYKLIFFELLTYFIKDARWKLVHNLFGLRTRWCIEWNDKSVNSINRFAGSLRRKQRNVRMSSWPCFSRVFIQRKIGLSINSIYCYMINCYTLCSILVVSNYGQIRSAKILNYNWKKNFKFQKL